MVFTLLEKSFLKKRNLFKISKIYGAPEIDVGLDE